MTVHVCVCGCACSFAQLCLTLCDPMDGSQRDSSVHGTSQARVLKWVAISFSRGSSQPRNRTLVSRQILQHCATWEAPGVLTLWGQGQGFFFLFSSRMQDASLVLQEIRRNRIQLYLGLAPGLPGLWSVLSHLFLPAKDHHVRATALCVSCLLTLKVHHNLRLHSENYSWASPGRSVEQLNSFLFVTFETSYYICSLLQPTVSFCIDLYFKSLFWCLVKEKTY